MYTVVIEKLKFMKTPLLITTHYLFKVTAKSTVDFFFMVKHVFMGCARLGKGEGTPQSCTNLRRTMECLHRVARFRGYSVYGLHSRYTESQRVWFLAVLVRNKVSIFPLVILVSNRARLWHPSPELGMFLRHHKM